jgi:hypothetical protein
MDNTTFESLRERVIAWLRELDGGAERPRGSGYNPHNQAVTRAALFCNEVKGLPADAQVVEIGALLHDIGYWLGGTFETHDALGAARVREVAPTLGCDAAFTAAVAQTVAHHSRPRDAESQEDWMVSMGDLIVNTRGKTKYEGEITLAEVRARLPELEVEQTPSA